MAVPLVYVTNLLMARLYGAEAMGTYYLAFNLMVSIGVFCCLGLNTGLLRFVSASRAESQAMALKTLFGPAIGLAIGLSLIAAVGLFGARHWISGYFHSPHLAPALQFMVLALPFYVASILLTETVRALGGVRLVVLQAHLLTPLGFLVLVVALAHVGRFLNPAAALVLAFFLVTLVGLGVLSGSRELRKTLSQDSNLTPRKASVSLGHLLVYCWPIFLGSVVSLGMAGIDSLILGLFTPPETVAYYNVATKTAPLVMLPLLAVNAVVPPLFARFYAQGDLGSLEMVSRTTARWMYFVALPLALLLILLGPQLLGFLGPDFMQARFALSILAVAQLINVAAGSVGFILLMTGHQRTLLVFQAAVGLGVLPLMTLGGAWFGLNGVAAANALGLAGINILMAWGVWRRLRIKPYAQKIGCVNLGGIVGGALFILSQPYLGVAAAAALFSLGYLALVARPLILEFQTVFRRPLWLEAIR